MSVVLNGEGVGLQRRGGREITFSTLLLIISVARSIGFLLALWGDYAGRDGYLKAPNQAFGADFINLWAAGKMTIARLFGDIYLPEAFMAYQQSFLPVDIGFRLWAYPPHSLLFAWPFGLLDFYPAFLVWSALGLSVLIYGARKFGFGWTETGILALSPAAMQNIVFGQTGNLACGLLLVALAGRTAKSYSAIGAAALLTIKPQTGFLLPLIWLRNRRWGLIGSTVVATGMLIALSIALFGIGSWQGYVGSTLPDLAELESQGAGSFLRMIPSAFISMRLLGFDAHASGLVHFTFAGMVMLVLVWRLWAEHSQHGQAALILIGICLITPYMHLYDLTVLVAGGLILMRDNPHLARSKVALGIAWALPMMLGLLAVIKAPVAPLLVLVVFAVACLPDRSATLTAAERA